MHHGQHHRAYVEGLDATAYENRRADYVDAIWDVIDFADVAARLDRARGLVLIEN